MKKILLIALSLLLIFSLVTVSYAADTVYKAEASWKIEASSDKSTSIGKAFDGDMSTYWHTNYTVGEDGKNIIEPCPHTVTVTFPEALEISGVRYVPKQKTERDASVSGTWKAADIYTSADGKSFKKAATQTFDVAESRETVDISIKKGKYRAMRIVVTEGINGYATAAEIGFIGSGASSESKTKTETKPETNSDSLLSERAYEYDAFWKIEASSDKSTSIGKAFDGDTSTYWHTNYTVGEDGKNIIEPCPHTVTVTFPEALEIEGIRYIPRQMTEQDRSASGIWKAADFYGSVDGKNYEKIGSSAFDVVSSRNASDVKIKAGKYKAMRVTVTDSVNGYATAAEIEFLKPDDGKAENDKKDENKKEALKSIIMAVDSDTAMISGKTVKLVASPVIKDGRTLVPVRFVSENLGSDVDWNNDTREVTISDGSNRIVLKIDSDNVSVNGVLYKLDVPAMIIGNSTMVPIRFVSESLGAKVEWNGEKKEITITMPLTIACWGDSLTFGDGAVTSSYPKVLEKLTGAKVYNLGIGGETALTIAARQGAYDIVFDTDFVIPESGTVELPLSKTSDGNFLLTEGGGHVFPRRANAKWNPCFINGVEGAMSVDVDTTKFPRVLNSVKFSRKESGTATEVKKGDKLITSASYVNADINIIYIGVNGCWGENNKDGKNTAEDSENLIGTIKKMIENTPDPEKYLVIGYTVGEKNSWNVLDEEMKKAFGEHYVDAKSDLVSEESLKAKGVTPTENDKADIAKGAVPESFRKSADDKTHLNDLGYTVLAEAVYKKITELGYIK